MNRFRKMVTVVTALFAMQAAMAQDDVQITEIPASIIPSGIRDYVKKNYASSTIKDIKKKRYGYEVELTGDIDLEFNSKGKFLRVDD